MTALLEAEIVRLPSGLTFEVLRGGSGRRVVYLHPMAGLQRDDRFALALAERFEVIAPLAPGITDATQLDHVRDIHDLALAYDDLFSAIGLREVTLVGHSFGGMVAAEVAAHAPHRVDRLALIAPFGLWNDAYPVLDVFAIPSYRLPAYLWADPSGHAAQAGPVTGEAPLGDPIEANLRAIQALVTAGKFLIPIPDRGLSRRLYRLSMPTLLMWGSDDRVISPRYADDYRAGVAHAEVSLVAGAGHMVTLEATAEVLDCLARFSERPVGHGRRPRPVGPRR